jgi:hypothetical protein
VDYEKPMRIGRKQGEMLLNCFYLYAEIGTVLAMKQKKPNSCISPKLEFRGAGMQVPLVTMSHPSLRASAPPCLLLFIKGPLKAGWGILLFFQWLLLFAFGFYFGLLRVFCALAFALAFCVGSFWKEKELLKGKEWLNRG